jgi:hypothetical protein
VSEQNIDQKDQLLLCFKIDPTVKRSSVTDKEVLRFKDLHLRDDPAVANLGERAKRFAAQVNWDPATHVRSERSPLHDVRQHARSCFVEHDRAD